MATPIFVCGAECGVAGVNATIIAGPKVHWSTFGATVTVQSAGSALTAGTWSLRSYKFNPAAATTDTLAHLHQTAIASPATMVVRFKIMFTTLPNAIRTIVSDSGAGLCGIRYNNTGTKLEAWAGAATATFAGSFVPVVGRWYTIEVKMVRDTTHTTDWYVDGVAQTQASKGSQSAGTITGVTFGSNATGSGGNAAATATYYVDDICCSATAADFGNLGGVGGKRAKVVGLFPSADGTHVFTHGAGSPPATSDFGFEAAGSLFDDDNTTVYTHVDDLLNNNTDMIRGAGTGAGNAGYCEVQLADTPADVASINGVEVVVGYAASASTGTNAGIDVQLNDNGTADNVLGGIDVSNGANTLTTVSKAYAQSPNLAAAWTKTRLDALRLRFGYQSDITPVPYWHAFCVEADYIGTPNTATFETGSDGSTVSVGDSGSLTAWDAMSIGAGATFAYDNDHVKEGSLAAKVATPGSVVASYASWQTKFTHRAEHYGRIYLYFTANPAARAQVVVVRGVVSGNLSAAVRVETDGKLNLLDSAGNVAGQSTAGKEIALNQWIRVEYRFVHASATGYLECKLFNSADSASPTETITTAANLNTLGDAAWGDDLRFGMGNANASVGPFWVDLIVGDATEYPGAEPVAQSIGLTPVSVPVVPVALGRTGAVSLAVTPTVTPVTPTTLGITAGGAPPQTPALAPVAMPVVPVTLGRTAHIDLPLLSVGDPLLDEGGDPILDEAGAEITDETEAALDIVVTPQAFGVTTGTSVALAPASIAVSAAALARTLGGASAALTPVVVPVTPQAFARTVGGVSPALTPVAITAAAQTLARTVGAVAPALTPAAVTVVGQPLDRTPGAVTPAVVPVAVPVVPSPLARTAANDLSLGPPTVAVTAQPLDISNVIGAVNLALAPVTVPVAPVALGRTAGAVTPALSPAAVAVSPVALDRTPGAVSAALGVATVAVAPQTLGTTPGAVSAPLTPPTVAVAAVALGRSAAVALGLTPGQVTVSPVALARTAGGIDLAASPATVHVTPIILSISTPLGPISLPIVDPVDVQVVPLAFGRSVGGATPPLSPAVLTVAAQPLVRDAHNALGASPAVVQVLPVLLGRTVGGATRALTPAVVQVLPSGLVVTNIAGAALSLNPVTIQTLAAALGHTGAVSLAATPATVVVDGRILGLGLAVQIALTPGSVPVVPAGLAVAAGGTSSALSPAVVHLAAQLLGFYAPPPFPGTTMISARGRTTTLVSAERREEATTSDGPDVTIPESHTP